MDSSFLSSTTLTTSQDDDVQNACHICYIEILADLAKYPDTINRFRCSLFISGKSGLCARSGEI